jgi:hypothetical protein
VLVAELAHEGPWKLREISTWVSGWSSVAPDRLAAGVPVRQAQAPDGRCNNRLDRICVDEMVGHARLKTGSGGAIRKSRSNIIEIARFIVKVGGGFVA